MPTDGQADAINPDKSDHLFAERVILHDRAGQPVGPDAPLAMRQMQAASTVLVIPWAAGESRSGYVDLADGALIGIAVREAFTESTLSLEASVTPTDEASWRRIFDGPRTVAWSNAVTGNQYRDAPLFPLRFLRFIRFRSSVPQATATAVAVRTAPSVI